MAYLIFTSGNLKPLFVHEKYFDSVWSMLTLRDILVLEYYSFSTPETNEIIEPWNDFDVQVGFDKIIFSGDNGIIEFTKTEVVKID